MPALLTYANIALSFFATLLVLPYWIRRAREHGFVGTDMQKLDKPKVAEMGGICAVLGIIVGLLTYVGLQVFIYHSFNPVLFQLAATTSVLIACMIGLIDNLLGWKIGLRQYQKVLLTLLIPIPLMVVNAGEHIMTLPLVGNIDFGIIYPLLIIPLGIIGASNAFNMLAGMNGLEAGQGMLILGTLGYIAWGTGHSPAALIAACAVAALLAFWLFNRYPARVFPGDPLTYSVGTIIAIVAILGNMEKFALILFIPYFVEFVLKLRGDFKKESFARVRHDGALENQHAQWYSLTHVAVSFLRRVKGSAYEQQVVWAIHLAQALLCIIVLFLYQPPIA